jgi:hypothetical protein
MPPDITGVGEAMQKEHRGPLTGMLYMETQSVGGDSQRGASLSSQRAEPGKTADALPAAAEPVRLGQRPGMTLNLRRLLERRRGERRPGG